MSILENIIPWNKKDRAGRRDERLRRDQATRSQQLSSRTAQETFVPSQFEQQFFDQLTTLDRGQLQEVGRQIKVYYQQLRLAIEESLEQAQTVVLVSPEARKGIVEQLLSKIATITDFSARLSTERQALELASSAHGLPHTAKILAEQDTGVQHLLTALNTWQQEHKDAYRKLGGNDKDLNNLGNTPTNKDSLKFLSHIGTATLVVLYLLFAIDEQHNLSKIINNLPAYLSGLTNEGTEFWAEAEELGFVNIPKFIKEEVVNSGELLSQAHALIKMDAATATQAIANTWQAEVMVPDAGWNLTLDTGKATFRFLSNSATQFNSLSPAEVLQLTTTGALQAVTIETMHQVLDWMYDAKSGYTAASLGLSLTGDFLRGSTIPIISIDGVPHIAFFNQEFNGLDTLFWPIDANGTPTFHFQTGRNKEKPTPVEQVAEPELYVVTQTTDKFTFVSQSGRVIANGHLPVGAMIEPISATMLREFTTQTGLATQTQDGATSVRVERADRVETFAVVCLSGGHNLDSIILIRMADARANLVLESSILEVGDSVSATGLFRLKKFARASSDSVHGIINSGSIMTVLAETDDFVKVRDGQGNVGWAPRSKVEKLPKLTTTTAQDRAEQLELLKRQQQAKAKLEENDAQTNEQTSLNGTFQVSPAMVEYIWGSVGAAGTSDFAFSVPIQYRGGKLTASFIDELDQVAQETGSPADQAFVASLRSWLENADLLRRILFSPNNEWLIAVNVIPEGATQNPTGADIAAAIVEREPSTNRIKTVYAVTNGGELITVLVGKEETFQLTTQPPAELGNIMPGFYPGLSTDLYQGATIQVGIQDPTNPNNINVTKLINIGSGLIIEIQTVSSAELGAFEPTATPEDVATVSGWSGLKLLVPGKDGSAPTASGIRSYTPEEWAAARAEALAPPNFSELGVEKARLIESLGAWDTLSPAVQRILKETNLVALSEAEVSALTGALRSAPETVLNQAGLYYETKIQGLAWPVKEKDLVKRDVGIRFWWPGMNPSPNAKGELGGWVTAEQLGSNEFSCSIEFVADQNTHEDFIFLVRPTFEPNNPEAFDHFLEPLAEKFPNTCGPNGKIKKIIVRPTNTGDESVNKGLTEMTRSSFFTPFIGHRIVGDTLIVTLNFSGYNSEIVRGSGEPEGFMWGYLFLVLDQLENGKDSPTDPIKLTWLSDLINQLDRNYKSHLDKNSLYYTNGMVVPLINGRVIRLLNERPEIQGELGWQVG